MSDSKLGLYDLLAEAKKADETSPGQSQWKCLMDDLANNDTHQLKPHFGRYAGAPKVSARDSQGRHEGGDWKAQAKQILRDEVQAVGQSQVFGKWIEGNPTDFFATILPRASVVIGEYAPHLSEILRVISLPVGNAPLEAKQGSLVGTS